MNRQPLTYCSFASETECLGVLILDGELNPLEASFRARVMGCNPGGELLAIPVAAESPDVSDREYLQMFENRGRLLSISEARELIDGMSIREWEEGKQ
jgi:hypothetical protein